MKRLTDEEVKAKMKAFVIDHIDELLDDIFRKGSSERDQVIAAAHLLDLLGSLETPEDNVAEKITQIFAAEQ